jgi:NAD(P)-dependent dehydrogenase (short-subunit alcohol dehydrogenase family)
MAASGPFRAGQLGPSLPGRIALVTGGGRGIGAAIAHRFAAAGARVVVTGRTTTEIEEVAAAIDGVAITVDLADRRATDALVDRLRRDVGRVDILCNNAGLAESRPLPATDDALWDLLLEVNATAAFRLCRALVPPMIEAGWGRVINLASNAGVSGYGYSAAYCASKHAMVGFTRALAIDLGTTGVTINAVCPGWVATQMAATAAARIADKTGRSLAESRQVLEKMSPQRRMVEVDEVAHAVAMLCAEEARSIHGQTLVIDGGAVLK